MNYEVEFSLLNDPNGLYEFKGFVNTVAEGEFEAGFNIGTLYHDMFEHWFENSKYYSTSSLSQCGEAVAMGVRAWLEDEGSVPTEYGVYNRYQGIWWNSKSTILSQVYETEEEVEEYGEAKYPNDFDFKHLDSWDGEISEHIRYQWECVHTENYYVEIEEKYLEDILKAMSYGYYLGELLFEDSLEMIEDFLNNLKQWLSTLELQEEHWETCHKLPNYGRYKFKFSKEKISFSGEDIEITDKDIIDSSTYEHYCDECGDFFEGIESEYSEYCEDCRELVEQY